MKEDDEISNNLSTPVRPPNAATLESVLGRINSEALIDATVAAAKARLDSLGEVAEGERVPRFVDLLIIESFALACRAMRDPATLLGLLRVEDAVALSGTREVEI